MHSFSQGRVVINEFMAWPSCATTTEFIELMNFGPGPVNIGCYIVTNGQYSVTIPPNTILQAGQYFVLAGQNTIPVGCANVDSTITVDLNWTTCGCTDAPIPTTGDGFMQDGGSANEKIVLFDASFNIVDAVSRQLPVSSSNAITTSSVSGNCTPRSFDLDNLSIAYETINISTGRNNSFSRNTDGDCGWSKTPQVTAKAPNNTSSTSSATYSFSTLDASQCNGTTGSVSIQVSAPDVNSLFPMNYLLAHDYDSNGIYNDFDVYTYGVDSSASSIDINNIPYGRYRITVSSALGCNLRSFDFFIFNCYGVVLEADLKSFELEKFNGKYKVNWIIDHNEFTDRVVLEGSSDGATYQQLQTVIAPTEIKGTWSPTFYFPIAHPGMSGFRLKVVQKNGKSYYSQVVKLNMPANRIQRIWPNPAVNTLHLNYEANQKEYIPYRIYNLTSTLVKEGEILVNKGVNQVDINIQNLLPGTYHLLIGRKHDEKQIRAPFIKK